MSHAIHALIGLTLLALGLMSAAQAATSYRYTTHPTLSFPGSQDPIFTGVTEDRRAVGTYLDVLQDNWSFQKAGADERRLLLNGWAPIVQGVSSTGVMVGSLWRPAEGFIGFAYQGDAPLRYEGFGVRTRAMDINAAGVEVGSLETEASGVWCYHTTDFGATLFRVDPADEFCEVHDITDGGEAGGSHTPPGRLDQGWVWRQHAFTMIDVPGSLATWVENLAADGSVQGSYLDANFQGRGFSLEPNGTFVTIHVPGALQTFVKGGNRRGDLVGGYLTTDAQGQLVWGSFYANPVRPR